jgi:membrane-bound lytic murein transglycosylase D
MKIKLLKIFWLFVFCLAVNNCCVSSDSDRVAQRLQSLEKTLPLPYNVRLDKAVQTYAGKTLPDAFVVSEPFIDSALAQRGMPQEMKYLPLALTAMRTDFAKDDRCGVWSLPPLVAIRYGLCVNDRRDERYAIQASTTAALDYLNDLHHQYGDWWYAILAYTNSPNALHHALDRNKASLQLWDFDQRGLLPNTSVITNLIACICAYEGTERPTVKNPSIVEPVERPKIDKPIASSDTSNKQTSSTVTKQDTSSTSSHSGNKPSTGSTTQKYKVKKGDTLTSIAKKYHVKVKELMKWNKLKNDKIYEGQTLIIKK